MARENILCLYLNPSVHANSHTSKGVQVSVGVLRKRNIINKSLLIKFVEAFKAKGPAFESCQERSSINLLKPSGNFTYDQV
jgi:hypothetical protein